MLGRPTCLPALSFFPQTPSFPCSSSTTPPLLLPSRNTDWTFSVFTSLLQQLSHFKAGGKVTRRGRMCSCAFTGLKVAVGMLLLTRFKLYYNYSRNEAGDRHYSAWEPQLYHREPCLRLFKRDYQLLQDTSGVFLKCTAQNFIPSHLGLADKRRQEIPYSWITLKCNLCWCSVSKTALCFVFYPP